MRLFLDFFIIIIIITVILTICDFFLDFFIHVRDFSKFVILGQKQSGIFCSLGKFFVSFWGYFFLMAYGFPTPFVLD